METPTYVIEGTQDNFQQTVVQRSLEVPVLLDCWSPQCEPCKTLTPILEKLAAEYAGRFELVKVNVDVHRQVAMALGVRSVPTVYLIKGGQPVDGFAGAQPEANIRQLLDRHVAPPAYDPLDAAKEAMAEGDLPQAAAHFRALLDDQPDHGEALLGMARVALTEAGPEAAEAWLDQIKEENSAYVQATRLRGVIAFSGDAGDVDALRNAVETNPKDVESWYQLGASLAVASAFEPALNAFLEVVKLDREFREDAGRKALLSLFDLLGAEDPAVIAARRQLACLLF